MMKYKMAVAYRDEFEVDVEARNEQHARRKAIIKANKLLKRWGGCLDYVCKIAPKIKRGIGPTVCLSTSALDD